MSDPQDSSTNAEGNSDRNTPLETPAGSEKSRPSSSSGNDSIVDNLTIGQVRWFYRELAANSEWTPFGGHDTLVVEAAYMKLPPDLKGPKPLEVPKANSSKEPKVEAEYSVASPKVTVLSGLYELDLSSRKASSIYWPGEMFQCTRGTWFYKSWQPVDEITADLIEQEHLKAFKGKTTNSPPSPQPIHHQTFTDCNVDWYSPNEVYIYSNNSSQQFMKSFTRTIGYFQKSAGTRVFRAYKTLATSMDKPKDISHMVFVVHGIGQMLNMNIGDRVFGNTCAIRTRVSALKEEFFPASNQFAGFFPVEWRSKVALCDTMIESITPVHIKYVRDFLNTSVLDLMYYVSPVYCGEIQDCVANEMNRLYMRFCERNTHIKPKVSVIAHSLGAIILYDILTGHLPQGYNGPGQKGKSRLMFELDCLFFFGSPLSVFLALRLEKGTNRSHLFPPSLCNRLFNVYHVTDPIAYRLEPLVINEYCRIAPLQIQPYNADKLVRYCDMPLVAEGDEFTSPNAGAASPFDSSTPTTSHTASADAQIAAGSASDEAPPRASTASAPHPPRSRKSNNLRWNRTQNPPPDLPPLTELLEHRMDYVLTTGGTGPFIFRSVLVSHMAYWGDNDVAFFVLTRLFPELEDEVCSEDNRSRIKKRKLQEAGP